MVLYVLVAKTVFKRTQRNKSVKSVSDAARNDNDVSMDLSVSELSATANMPGVADSEDFATIHRERTKTPGTEDCTTTAHGLGSVNVTDCEYLSQNPAPHDTPISTSSAVMLDIPMTSIKAATLDEPLDSALKLFRRPHKNTSSRTVRHHSRTRLRRNTFIMFILTLCFTILIVIYFVLAILMVDTERFFNDLTVWQAVLAKCFLRLYYFNSLINAVVYGLLDPRFKWALRRVSRRISASLVSKEKRKNVSPQLEEMKLQ